MSRHELAFDVSQVGRGEALTQMAWLFVPDDPSQAKAALVCLPGGSYDKRYWHLDVPGHPGYSFGEHLAAQGFVVVALDHLGVGDSSDPQQSGDLGVGLLSAGDATVATQVRDRLAAGTLVDVLPPTTLPVVGVGHSMGACLLAAVQATFSPFDAVALLGFGVQIANIAEAVTQAPSLDELSPRTSRWSATSSGRSPVP